MINLELVGRVDITKRLWGGFRPVSGRPKGSSPTANAAHLLHLWGLIKDGKKLCIKCNEIKDLALFSKASSRWGGYQHACKVCNSKYAKDNAEHIRKLQGEYRKARPELWHKWSSERRLIKRASCVGWADPIKMKVFYDDARARTDETGIDHTVDHIVPLKSKIVCGLHCEANLQVLTRSENSKKGNRHWPDMP